MISLQARCDYFAGIFPNKASHPYVVQEQGRDVLYGTWVIGNDYRSKTPFYGAYPPSYLTRVMALFPDIPGSETIHVFSGSLPEGNYTRCDLVQPAELSCSVYDLPQQNQMFRLGIADPPYSDADAIHYNTPNVNRPKAMDALAQIIMPGGYLVWLDTAWPMHSKTQWVTVGRILVQRSTNHRVRVCYLFERVL